MGADERGVDAMVRLLLIDDHPLVRDGLRARLGGIDGIEVVGEAGHAREALAAVEALRPTMALVDIGMKEVNGIELTLMLSQRHPELAVLILSMYDNPEYVQQAMQAGARGYVLKDAPSSEIVGAIQTVRQGGTYLSPSVTKRLFRAQEPKPLLSPRESEILACLAKGQSSKQIAEALGLSVRTVETHRQNIKRKLVIDGQAELIKYAVEHVRRYGG
ncbi:response regulator [Aquincola agrisoli]